jgi:hypothetical protein
MPKPPRTYTRLTRRSASVATYQSLWLAADHLLVVTSTGYTEEYRRVRLGDIKGFFVTASGRRLYCGLPWGIAAVFSGGAMISTLVNRGTPLWSGIFLGLSLVALVWNYLLGPGCRAFVVTGVQTARLPSLYRRPKTRKVLGRLEPLIIAAQADLAPARPETPEATPANPAPPSP